MKMMIRMITEVYEFVGKVFLQRDIYARLKVLLNSMNKKKVEASDRGNLTRNVLAEEMRAEGTQILAGPASS